MSERVIRVEDAEQRFIELERIVTTFLPEERSEPPEVREKLREALFLYYRGYIEECIVVLNKWYEVFRSKPRDVYYTFYDEIRIIEILLKCYEKKPSSLIEIISELEKEIFLLKQQKELSEIQRLIDKNIDPDVVDVLKILKEKLMRGT